MLRGKSLANSGRIKLHGLEAQMTFFKENESEIRVNI